MDKKYYLIGGIGLLVAVVLIAGFMFFSGDKNVEGINKRLYIEDKNPNGLSKPELPTADIVMTVNGKQERIESKCNSQVIKCTRNGCEEIC